MVIYIKKKCPECGSKAVKLYQNKSFDGKRAWVPTAWTCTKCGYTYNVAAETLMYKIGSEPYDEKYKQPAYEHFFTDSCQSSDWNWLHK